MAIVTADGSLPVFEDHFGEAVLANKKGDTDAAFRALKRAFACLDRSVPAQRRLAAQTCVHLADVYLVRGKYNFADFLAAIGLYNLPTTMPWTAVRLRALSVLGIGAWYRSDLSAAFVWFKQITDQIDNSDLIHSAQKADAWSNLGLVYQAFDRWSDAISAQQEAVTFACQAAIESQIFSIRLRLSNALQDAGRFVQSRCEMAAIRPSETAAPMVRLRWLNAWALLQERSTSYKAASDAFDEAQELFDDLSPVLQATVANVLSNSARCKLQLGHEWEAQSLCDRLNDIVAFGDTPYACRKSALELAADIAVHRGDRVEANRLLRELEYQCASTVGRTSNDFVEAVCRRAQVIRDCGKEMEAFEHVQTNVFGEGDRDTSIVLLALRLSGTWATKLGFLDDATDALCAAFAAVAVGGSLHQDCQVSMALAGLAERTGRLSASILFTKAVAIATEKRIVSFRDNSFEVDSLFVRDNDVFDLLVSRLVSAGRLAEASRVHGAAKDRRSPKLATMDPATTTIVLLVDEQRCMDRIREHFRQCRCDVDASVLPSVGAFGDRHQRRATIVEECRSRSYELVNHVLSEAWVEEASLPLVPKGSDTAVPAPDTLRLRYLVGRNSLVIEHIDSKEKGQRRIDIDDTELSAMVFELVQSITSIDASWSTLAEALYGVLIEPVLPFLEGKTRLSVSVSGVLCALPFGCLHMNGQMLLERFGIEVHTGAGAGHNKEFDPQGVNVLAAGADAFPNLPSLPRLAQELEAVRQRFPATTVLINDDLTAAAFEEELQRHPAIVHLAGHFTLKPEDIGNSWFALGGGEVMSLNQLRNQSAAFRSTVLVWLSGCETAVAGAGQESLASFFTGSGVDTVIASLWPVSDVSTERLVRAYYERLEERGPVHALRDAQLAIMQTPHHDMSKMHHATGSGGPMVRPLEHPYHWAGFAAYV